MASEGKSAPRVAVHVRDGPQIPKHLMERWSSINQEDIQLATIRVYHEAVAANGKKPRIMMMLPPNPDGTCDEYELDMVNESVENQIVVAEREKYPGVPHRARTTILTGRVKHECNLRPLFTERYRQRLKQRTLLANTPKKQIMRIEEAGIGGRGSINMLTSGAANQRPFTFGVRTSHKLSVILGALTLIPSAASQAKAGEGPIRAHGAYATKQPARSPLRPVQRA